MGSFYRVNFVTYGCITMVMNGNGSAVGLVADSDTITIMFETSTQTVQVQSPTLPEGFLFTAGPGRRISILKGAVVSCLSNRYILSGCNNKLLC